jgi:hypothetical protein
MVFMTVNNTVITSVVPDEVRGRVMSVLMMSFGLMPFGAVPAAILAESIGVSAVVAMGGLGLMITVALAYVVFPQFRTLDGAISIQRARRDAEHRERFPAGGPGAGLPAGAPSVAIRREVRG